MGDRVRLAARAYHAARGAQAQEVPILRKQLSEQNQTSRHGTRLVHHGGAPVGR